MTSNQADKKQNTLNGDPKPRKELPDRKRFAVSPEGLERRDTLEGLESKTAEIKQSKSGDMKRDPLSLESQETGNQSKPVPPVMALLSKEERLFRRRAGVGPRNRALFIDVVIMGVGALWVAAEFSEPFRHVARRRFLSGGDDVVQLTSGIVDYYGLLMALSFGLLLTAIVIGGIEAVWGTSPGKKLRKLQILDESGNPPDRSNLLLRAVVKYLGHLILLIAIPKLTLALILVGALVYGVIGYGHLLAFGEKRQTLHDRFSETAVFPMEGREDAVESVLDTLGISIDDLPGKNGVDRSHRDR